MTEDRLAEVLELAERLAHQESRAAYWDAGAQHVLEKVVPELVEEIRRLQDDKEEHDLWSHSGYSS